MNFMLPMQCFWGAPRAGRMHAQVFAPLGAFVFSSDFVQHVAFANDVRDVATRWGQRVSRGRAEISDVMGMQQPPWPGCKR